MQLPSRAEPWPRVDDHLVEPDTREEMIEGVRIYAQPASLPHASTNVRIDAVMAGNARDDYEVASDLLTRVDHDSDFASDVCVLRRGIDPESGARYLEELAIEIVSSQSLARVTKRAKLWAKRGVRRIFAVFTRKQEVREWLHERETWLTLASDATIDDPILVQPIPVRALLQRDVAERAVIEGFARREVPALLAREQAARDLGMAEGMAAGRKQALVEAIAAVCEVLGLRFAARERAELAALDADALEAALASLRTSRRWPFSDPPSA